MNDPDDITTTATDDAVRDWAAGIEAPAPTGAEVDALMARARRPSWAPVLLVGSTLAVAAVALLVLSVAWFALPSTTVPAPAPVVVAPAPPAPSPEIEVWTGRVEHDGDTFVIDGTLHPTERPEGRVLELAGTVDVVAAKRTRDEALVIGAGDWRVRVVGTQFTVTTEPFQVSVTEGIVAVSQVGRDAVRVHAGERFVDGAVVRPPPVPEPTATPLPALSELKRAVLNGQLDAARAGLTARLEADPTDAPSWTLLARLEQRSGDASAAVDAWRQVVRHGEPGAAQQARYEAAVLLERSDPAAAIPLLRDFLKTPDPLAPEARRRLGSALLATGDDSGRSELERVISEHPGTAAAAAAEADLRR